MTVGLVRRSVLLRAGVGGAPQTVVVVGAVPHDVECTQPEADALLTIRGLIAAVTRAQPAIEVHEQGMHALRRVAAELLLAVRGHVVVVL